MNGSTSGRQRSSGPSNPVRVALFAASAVLLLGVALAAGGLGPWAARPISGPGERPTRTPTVITRPTMSSVKDDVAQQSPSNSAVGWGIRIVLIAVLAILLILLARWIYGRFRELAQRQTVRPGAGIGTIDTTGLQAPPPVLEHEAGRHFDPRQAADAIISCWLWVERAAAAVGAARHEQDTPTEFLQRYLHDDKDSPRDVDPKLTAAAAELLPLYQRARFDHVALSPDAATRARAAAGVLCAQVRRAGDLVVEQAAGDGPAAGTDTSS